MAEQTIKRGETADIVRLNEPGAELRFRQEEGSTLRIHILHLSAGEDLTADDSLYVEQAGKGCRTEVYALNFLHGHSHAGLHTCIRHSTGGGTSTQLVKFVLADHADGQFRGDLHIAPNAQQTEALQTNRNLLLSDHAVMRTQPRLEIYADDVKAGHGASTGRLDESALFYMQQRCISP